MNRWLSALSLLILAGCGGGDSDSATSPSGGGTLVVEDLVVGTGATAAVGDTLTVHYIGTLTNGTKFDSSYDQRHPVCLPGRRGASHRRVGPGRAGHEGRREAPSDDSAWPTAVGDRV